MVENMVQPDRLRTTIEYGTWALHAKYLMLQTHTQNTYLAYLFNFLLEYLFISGEGNGKPLLYS